MQLFIHPLFPPLLRRALLCPLYRLSTRVGSFGTGVAHTQARSKITSAAPHLLISPPVPVPSPPSPLRQDNREANPQHSPNPPNPDRQRMRIALTLCCSLPLASQPTISESGHLPRFICFKPPRPTPNLHLVHENG